MLRETLFKEYNRLLFFQKNNFTTYNDERTRLEEYKNIKENIIKDARNLIRLKKLKKSKSCRN